MLELYLPELHAVHASDPAPEYFPSVQSWQTAELVAIVEALAFPASQSVQDPAPESEYLPEGHTFLGDDHWSSMPPFPQQVRYVEEGSWPGQ